VLRAHPHRAQETEIVAVTVEQFVAIHPEFANIAANHPAMVSTALADAAAETDATVCGAESDRVVRLKAADVLARSPFGQQAALVDDEGRTPYARSLEALVDRLGLSYRTVLE
jgi:hypothetical protein